MQPFVYDSFLTVLVSCAVFLASLCADELDVIALTVRASKTNIGLSSFATNRSGQHAKKLVKGCLQSLSGA